MSPERRHVAGGPRVGRLPLLLSGVALVSVALGIGPLPSASASAWASPASGSAGAPTEPAPRAGRERRRLRGDPVVLVRDGRPRSVIVLQAAPGAPVHPDDRAAAEMLQEWLERITGARVEIAIGADAAGRVPILIGRAALDAGLRLDDIDSRSREGVRVRVQDDRVLLAGQDGNARIKAAAVLLEELGCRWYMEGELGKQCPSSDTLAVQPVEITDRPGFLYRRIWSAEGWARDTAWKAWNGSGGLPLQMGHDWDLIRPSDFDEHPDWFRLDAHGQRQRGPWLNTGNPELRRVFADRLIASMRPGDNPSISPPDNIRADHSPASERYDDPASIEPSSEAVSMSNRFMSFANTIAARVGEAYPDAILGFHAYSDYSLPPTLVDRLEPNLCIWIAPIRFSRFHRLGAPQSPSRQRLVEVIDGWTRVASMLGYRTYGYNLGESMTPFAKLTTWSHDIPYLARRGFVGVSIESFPTWDLSAPSIYLSLRLAYDPLADADAILEDFYRGFYGPAASAMREYWQAVDLGWQGLRTESGSVYSVHRVFTPERLARLDHSLSRAAAAAAGDPVRTARVAMARTGYLHAVDFVAVREALNGGRIDEASAVYRRWEARTQESIAAGAGHAYDLIYLRRFVGAYLQAALRALHPQEEPPRSLLAVLPDTMELAYEADLQAAGAALEPLAARVPSSHWRRVRTFGATLDQQGLPDRLETMWYRSGLDVAARPGARYYLHFSRIDGEAAVWVNGRPARGVAAAGSAPATTFPALAPFTVEITDLLVAGDNRVAIRVDHRRLHELALGGIVGPVYLLARE